jgi:hypothetical protein
MDTGLTRVEQVPRANGTLIASYFCWPVEESGTAQMFSQADVRSGSRMRRTERRFVPGLGIDFLMLN